MLYSFLQENKKSGEYGAAQDQYLVGEPNFQLDLAFVRLLCIGIVLHGGTDCIEH